MGDRSDTTKKIMGKEELVRKMFCGTDKNNRS